MRRTFRADKHIRIEVVNLNHRSKSQAAHGDESRSTKPLSGVNGARITTWWPWRVHCSKS
jgi:hypothetical protein